MKRALGLQILPVNVRDLGMEKNKLKRKGLVHCRKFVQSWRTFTCCRHIHMVLLHHHELYGMLSHQKPRHEKMNCLHIAKLFET
jgi:hypothetical protein